MKKIIGPTPHFEHMQGTVKQNDKYVSKDRDDTQLGDEGLCRYSTQSTCGSHVPELNQVRDAHRDDSDDAFEEHFASFVQYPSLKKHLKETKRSKRYSDIIEKGGGVTKDLRPWQAQLKKRIRSAF